MDTIVYKGKEYPTRTFDVETEDGAEMTITIATESLSEAIEDSINVVDSIEESIDTQIYFYIDNGSFYLEPEDICLNLLDEEMRFINEY